VRASGGRGRGRCASWEWFFPYHYAPLASDLAETCAALAGGAPALEPGVPFEPFQQLLAVLPPASAGLLPRPVAALMRDPRIKEFYPSDFRCGPSLPCALRVPVP
jgi:5'-3' exonuclease